MKTKAAIVLLVTMLWGSADACTPVTYTDAAGRELSREQVVQTVFNNFDYIVVGDVIEAESIVQYEVVNGRRRPHAFQRAVVVVRKSWKPSKRAGDKLQVYTDLNHSCNRALQLGSQSLIYASGSEPVEMSGWNTIDDLGFSSDDVQFLDRIAVEEFRQSAPKQPLQPTTPKNNTSD